MGYQAYSAPAAEPPEVQSIKSMLHIVRILAIIFGILLALGGLAFVAVEISFWDTCTAIAGNFCGASLGALLVGPFFILLFGIVDVVIYLQMKEIERMVDQRQYESAKAKTLLWMILGFILGGIIIGILLLIAYLKFDPVITWQRSGGGTMAAPAYGVPPAYGAPPAAAYNAPPPAAQPAMGAPPPAAAAPPMAAAPAAAPTTPCTRCGKPAVWVAQYSRWYCPAEQQYL